MADILPSIPDTSASEDAEPRVVGVDEDAADDVFAALSSETARSLFAALNDDPAHPSALAERVDTSLQNAQYHLRKLEDADLVEVVDTAYSAKGREMDVYAPADQPLVVFAGDRDDQSLLAQALGRLLGGLGILSAASVVAEGLFGRDDAAGDRFFGGGSGDAGAFDAASDDAADSGDGAAESGDSAADGGDGDAGARSSDGDGGGAVESEDAMETAADADDAAGQSGDAAEPAVDAVGTVADDLAWVGDLLAATGLSPGLAVLVLGSALLALGLAAWYVREQ